MNIQDIVGMFDITEVSTVKLGTGTKVHLAMNRPYYSEFAKMQVDENWNTSCGTAFGRQGWGGGAMFDAEEEKVTCSRCLRGIAHYEKLFSEDEVAK